MGIARRYEAVREEVAHVAVDAGRDPDEVLLLAVSKTVGLEGVADAVSAGARDLGENRPEQLIEKHGAFPDVRWHFIGNIQSRRIKDIVPCAALIHSLYREEHARKIDAKAAEIDKVQEVLLEVNVSGEESKSGLAPEDVRAMLDLCISLPNVRVRGLMTMAPQGDEEVARETFAGLKALQGDLREHLVDTDPHAAAVFDQLSMGMSEDWPEAIEEGSTIVRIGRAIFSDDFSN